MVNCIVLNSMNEKAWKGIIRRAKCIWGLILKRISFKWVQIKQRKLNPLLQVLQHTSKLYKLRIWAFLLQFYKQSICWISLTHTNIDSVVFNHVSICRLSNDNIKTKYDKFNPNIFYEFSECFKNLNDLKTKKGCLIW